MSEKKEVNHFLKRYPPNIRYLATGFANQIEQVCNYEVFGDSITDKESYRLNLTSLRGEMSKMTGSNSKGVYMFEDGQYDKDKDFSIALRPDISIVQLDDYIKELNNQLETATKEQAKLIRQELAKAEKQKEETTVSKNKKSESSEGSE